MHAVAICARRLFGHPKQEFFRKLTERTLSCRGADELAIVFVSPLHEDAASEVVYRGQTYANIMQVPCSLQLTPDKGTSVVSETFLEKGSLVHVESDVDEIDYTEEEALLLLQEMSDNERLAFLEHCWASTDEEGIRFLHHARHIGAFMNYSSSPTVVSVETDDGKLWITSRDVQKGEHLELDYEREFHDPKWFIDMYETYTNKPFFHPWTTQE